MIVGAKKRKLKEATTAVPVQSAGDESVGKPQIQLLNSTVDADDDDDDELDTCRRNTVSNVFVQRGYRRFTFSR